MRTNLSSGLLKLLFLRAGRVTLPLPLVYGLPTLILVFLLTPCVNLLLHLLFLAVFLLFLRSLLLLGSDLTLDNGALGEALRSRQEVAELLRIEQYAHLLLSLVHFRLNLRLLGYLALAGGLLLLRSGIYEIVDLIVHFIPCELGRLSIILDKVTLLPSQLVHLIYLVDVQLYHGLLLVSVGRSSLDLLLDRHIPVPIGSSRALLDTRGLVLTVDGA